MRLYLSVTRAVLFLHHGSYASAFSHVTWISNSFCWRHKKEGSGEAKMVGTSMVPPSDSSKDIHKPKNAVKGKSCIGEESQPLHALKPTISYNGPWSLKKNANYPAVWGRHLQPWSKLPSLSWSTEMFKQKSHPYLGYQHPSRKYHPSTFSPFHKVIPRRSNRTSVEAPEIQPVKPRTMEESQTKQKDTSRGLWGNFILLKRSKKRTPVGWYGVNSFWEVFNFTLLLFEGFLFHTFTPWSAPANGPQPRTPQSNKPTSTSFCSFCLLETQPQPQEGEGEGEGWGSSSG